MSISMGMVEQMTRSTIATRVSHIHLFEKGFYAHKEIGKTIPLGGIILEEIQGMSEVRAAVGRMKVTAMATSAHAGLGVLVSGILAEEESGVTKIHEMIIDGVYLGTEKRNPAVIGKKLAEKLEVGLGDKIVLTAQTLSGDIAAAAFRIAGVYKTPSSVFDAATVFVRRADMDRVLGLEGRIHEIAMLLENPDAVSEVAARLRQRYVGLDVMTWGDLAPELEYTNAAMSQMLYIYMMVILLALAFGIVNTMLMSVLERVRELGVLIAVGMNHRRIFAMVVVETVLLSICGAIGGMLLGATSIAVLGRTGINLSIVSRALASFGVSEILYPTMPFVQYPRLAALVVGVAVLSAVYPAIKAVKVDPVTAIRTYT
jgi:putative ABC transport system permease protein